MKANFIVSTFKVLWLNEIKNVFLIDSQILQFIKYKGLLKHFDEIKIAISLRRTRQEYVEDSNYINKKYEKLFPIIVERLKVVNRYPDGHGFFKKALSISFLRHITICHDIFKLLENNFDLDKHICVVIDQKSFYIPSDFDDHRKFFQDSDYGREQMFSIYCSLFYPGKIKSKAVEKYINNVSIDKPPESRVLTAADLFSRSMVFIKSLVKNILSDYKYESTEMIIFDTSISLDNIKKLVSKSNGAINTFQIKYPPLIEKDIDIYSRKFISSVDNEFERFEVFLFKVLEYGIPKMYIENFTQLYSSYYKEFSKFKNLRWVLCEWWIGHSHSSFVTGVLHDLKVKLVSVEHNIISHIFLGSNTKYLSEIADEYYSMGWSDNKYPLVVPGASLFEWSKSLIDVGKEHDVLLVLTAPIAYVPEVSGVYGHNGAFGVNKYFEFTKTFLKHLGPSFLSKLYMRSYPKKNLDLFMTWNQDFELREFIRDAKFYDDANFVSAKELIVKSRLVIVNYIATAHLESIFANVPTIFFLSKHVNHLNDSHCEAFDDLIRVGICQTCPHKAAKFVKNIVDCPEIWWSSDVVQNARKKFMDTYFGCPDDFIELLTSKVKS